MSEGVVKEILLRRGLTEADIARYLTPDYDQHLYDPFLMVDMEPAIERIVLAAERGEKVVVYGDYDIDGLTSSVIMKEALAYQSIDAEVYIPDRFDEGYGLNADAVRLMADKGVNLIVTVDCGVTAMAEVRLANELGIDVVVTDHHSVPETIPEAVAVIDPKRPEDTYPFKELCGAGVAFKVVQALQKRTGKPASGQEKWLLDLVALGTIGDVMDLLDENRVLVKYGLMVMARTRRPGLRALAETAGLNIAKIESTQIGFVLGPRLNAAGRMQKAGLAYELLATTDAVRARIIAAELEELNARRREEQEKIFSEADDQAAQQADAPVIVVAGADWSHGIVGIVAAKLADKWERPVFVGQIIDGKIKGSARSRGKYDIVSALRANSELLEKFGGHFFAAGATFDAENLEALKEGLVGYYFETADDDNDTIDRQVDLRLNDLKLLSWDTYEQLEIMQPFGAGNPRPIFELRGIKVVRSQKLGSQGRHLKMHVADESGRTLEGIGFNFGDMADLVENNNPVMYVDLIKNEFRGKLYLEFGIKKIDFE